jgi:hypothetical protein
MCANETLLFLTDEQMDRVLAYAKEREVDLISAIKELIPIGLKKQALNTATKVPIQSPVNSYSIH